MQVTINGFTFETTIGVMGGKYKIPVSAERRQAANVIDRSQQPARSADASSKPRARSYASESRTTPSWSSIAQECWQLEFGEL